MWEISISISIQNTRNGPGRSRKLWPKNAHVDTLPFEVGKSLVALNGYYCELLKPWIQFIYILKLTMVFQCRLHMFFLSHEFSGTDSRGSGDTFLRKEFSCWIRSREGSSPVFKSYVNCYIWHFRRRWKYCHPDNLIKLQTESREMKDEMNSVSRHSLPLDSICTLTLQSLHNTPTWSLQGGPVRFGIILTHKNDNMWEYRLTVVVTGF